MSDFRRTSLAALGALAFTLSACEKPHEAPKTGDLTQHFTMVDTEGRNYGVVELDPMTGGRMFDAQGRLIGRIIPPGPEVAPIAPPAPVVVPAP